VRAALLTGYGEPPTFELSDVPDPHPGPGEVAVDLVCAALNRRDWWLWRAPDTPLPVILGSDGAGRVGELGDDVEEFELGQEVVIDATLGWGNRDDAAGEQFEILGSPRPGTFAQRVVVPAANVHRKPPRLSWEEAAALNLAGLTAWRAAVTHAGADSGRTILVTGAGSGVSTFAVQIAIAKGARVFVTSGSQAKIDRAIELGASGGVVYHGPNWPEEIVELAGAPLDAAIDSYGAQVWACALRALRRGGRLVSFGDTGHDDAVVPPFEVYWSWRSIVGTTMGSPREFSALLQHVDAASWRPVVDSVHPLDRVDAAADRLESPERFGKVVVRIADG
jgi:zinc-binding alcohol dehydrogenase/oxidoreductase